MFPSQPIRAGALLEKRAMLKRLCDLKRRAEELVVLTHEAVLLVYHWANHANLDQTSNSGRRAVEAVEARQAQMTVVRHELDVARREFDALGRGALLHANCCRAPFCMQI